MSVLIPDFKVYQYIESGLIFCAHHSSCDEKFSSSIYHYMRSKDTILESNRLVKSWLTLNLKSYAERYREKFDANYLKFYKRGGTDPINAYQLLKYLICLRYNIEPETITRQHSIGEDSNLLTEQDKKDIEILEAFIDDLKMSIINRTPEYEKAKWYN